MLPSVFNLVTFDEIIKQPGIPKLRWRYNSKDDLLPIPFNGSPYIMLGKQEYHCHRGKDLNLGTKEKRKAERNESRNQRRKTSKPTKKSDCPVKFTVKKIFRFSEFKLEKISQRYKEKMSKEIRTELERLKHSKENRCMGTLEYLVILPGEQHMHHESRQVDAIIQLPEQNRSGNTPVDIQSTQHSDASEYFDELNAARTSIEGLRRNVRSNLKEIIDLTYNMSEKSMLMELDSKVCDFLNDFKSRLYAGDNLPIAQHEIIDIYENKVGLKRRRNSSPHNEIPKSQKQIDY